MDNDIPYKFMDGAEVSESKPPNEQEEWMLRMPDACDAVDSYEFTIPCADGTTISLSDYRNKLPVVVWLFSPECPISQTMFDDMKILASDFLGYDKYVLLGAVMPGHKGEREDRWEAFQNKEFPKMPILLDRGTWFFNTFGKWVGIPSIIIFDACADKENTNIYYGKRTLYDIELILNKLFPWITRDLKPKKYTKTDFQDQNKVLELVEDYYNDQDPLASNEHLKFVSISWDPGNPDCAMICYERWYQGSSNETHYYEYFYVYYEDGKWKKSKVGGPFDYYISSESWTEDIGMDSEGDNDSDMSRSSMLPDLKAESLAMSAPGVYPDYNVYVPGEVILLTSSVTISGDLNEKAYTERWYVNDQKLYNFSIDPEDNAQGLVYWSPPSNGEYTIRYTVDPDNHIQESNEKNNAASVTFTVDDFTDPVDVRIGN